MSIRAILNFEGFQKQIDLDSFREKIKYPISSKKIRVNESYPDFSEEKFLIFNYDYCEGSRTFYEIDPEQYNRIVELL